MSSAVSGASGLLGGTAAVAQGALLLTYVVLFTAREALRVRVPALAVTARVVWWVRVLTPVVLLMLLVRVGLVLW